MKKTSRKQENSRMKTSMQEKRLEKLDLQKEKSFDINKNFDNFEKKGKRRRRSISRSRDIEKKKDFRRFLFKKEE